MSETGTYNAVGVAHQYSPRAPLVLDDVSLSVKRGAIHGIIGHNGAGKSTLLGVLAGRIHPTTGHLEENGVPVSYHSTRDALQRGVVTVYQELSVVPSLSVEDNILVGRPDRGGHLRSASRRRSLVSDALERVGLGARYRERLVGDLKFGERQRVEIARALSRQSRYLLLDEPTAGLDDSEVERLFEVLKRMAEGNDSERHGIVMVNHHIDQVLELADGYTVIRDGRVILSDARGDRPKAEIVAAIVGDEAGESAGPASHPGGESGEGLTAQEAAPRAPTITTGHAGLEVEGAQAVGVRCSRLSVAPGQIHGLYGLEGAGQDALMMVLAGQARLQAGRISLGKLSLGRLSSSTARRRGVLFLSGDRSTMIIPQISVLDNVLLPRIGTQGLRAPLVQRRKLQASARDALKRMDIRGNVEEPIQYLSGGNQQKAVISRAIVEQFGLLLLLEPTVGVDLGARRKIIEETREIARSRNVPVLVASSDEDDLLELCDSITVFRGGGSVSTLDVNCAGVRSTMRRLALKHQPTAGEPSTASPIAVESGRGDNYA